MTTFENAVAREIASYERAEERDAAAIEAFGEDWPIMAAGEDAPEVSEADVDGGYIDTYDEREDSAFDAWHDAMMAQWDDDPNPYLGTYSEE